MKEIDRFIRADDETTVTVELSTVGSGQVAITTFNRATGLREHLLFSVVEAQRVGQALLAAYAKAEAA
ncbi:hypothetical protein MHPYR_310076 [uncultured Mycobacterium sp.]|uniref:Uncharacterized protein n=1 Tax=uncultured Mycobacterium sp. TaxID=171292 RepID=A0A1Y5PCK7_9MYCO|nr:hypothetical protein MHPYR_310076 [uncultured Mycobacterium sp.]